MIQIWGHMDMNDQESHQNVLRNIQSFSICEYVFFILVPNSRFTPQNIHFSQKKNIFRKYPLFSNSLTFKYPLYFKISTFFKHPYLRLSTRSLIGWTSLSQDLIGSKRHLGSTSNKMVLILDGWKSNYRDKDESFITISKVQFSTIQIETGLKDSKGILISAFLIQILLH